MSNILNFEIKRNKEKNSSIINSKTTNKEFGKKISKKDLRTNLKIVNNKKNQKQFSEIKLITENCIKQYLLIGIQITNFQNEIIFNKYIRKLQIN